ncbi:hypothetical protein CLIB1423_13S00408 [[Candida] railenensis]|uniref:Zn(2)-C6 fungal-type domain-containing protein n=1 Tax=[Candida] railenensis TaxID=45579 RepID=A0A9P0VZE1_9ASCO|nr:hypothetical protein CLIB1423_13S00408 [[Candida] railenensis]
MDRGSSWIDETLRHTSKELLIKPAWVVKPPKPKHRITRNSCMSCKKLKIRCNEGIPRCEYCAATGRICNYANSASSKQKKAVLQMQSAAFCTPSTLLNSNWQSVGISKFTYKLLHFFQNHCVDMLTFGINRELEKVLTIDVPGLWQKSSLVRQAMLSFSALNLWPFCNLEDNLYQDSPDDDALLTLLNSNTHGDLMKKLITGPSSLEMGPINSENYITIHKFDKIKDINYDNESMLKDRNLFCATTGYFMDSLQQYSTALSEASSFLTASDSEETGSVLSQDEILLKSAELMISGVLILAFLIFHPHKLLPLVNFGESEEEIGQTDVMAIAKGIIFIQKNAPNILRASPYKIFLAHDDVLPSISREYPLIEKLKSRLDEWVAANFLGISANSESLELLESFQKSICLIEVCYNECIEKCYPHRLFRCFISSSPYLEAPVRNKDRFALKLVFYCSSLCMICRLQLFDGCSVWSDYMNWYRDYNFKTYGGWFNSDDESLYDLVFRNDSEFHLTKFSNLKFLDLNDVESFFELNR